MTQRIEWVLVDPQAPIAVGDVVSAEAGGLPTYRVTALDGGRLLLADESDHPCVLPLERIHWKARAA